MIWWKWILFAIITAGCSALYRMGGSGNYDTKARDIGCMICNMASLALIGLGGTWWQWIVASGLTFGAYTTYHKWLNPLFGDNKDDVKWYGWFMHGFAIGFALLIFYQSWTIILGRAFALGIFTMIWSEAIDNDVLEELGRGFLMNISILLLIIGG